MNLNRLLRADARKYSPVRIEAEALNKTLQRAKEGFWIGETKRYVSLPEFIYEQMLYIKKVWWFLQAGILVLLGLMMKTAVSETYIERCMGITAPIFIILILPELWKNVSSRSLEIEGASLFPLQKIMAARMILFGMVDLVLLTVFAGIGITSINISALEMLIHFVLPMMVTTCICLRLFSGRIFRGITPSVIACLLWLAIWTLVVLREDVYLIVSVPAWITLLVLVFFYTCYCVWRILSNSEQIYDYYMLGDI